MNNLENEKEIAKSIRKAAILKNWKLFKQSRLGMVGLYIVCLLYTSPSPRDAYVSRMPSSA